MGPGPRYVIPGWYATGRSTASFGNAGDLLTCPILCSEAKNFDRIGCEITVAGPAGTQARLGVYAWAAGVPGALELDAGLVLVDALAIREIVIALALPAGLHFLAIVHNANPAPTFRVLAPGAHPPVSGRCVGLRWNSRSLPPPDDRVPGDGCRRALEPGPGAERLEHDPRRTLASRGVDHLRAHFCGAKGGTLMGLAKRKLERQEAEGSRRSGTRHRRLGALWGCSRRPVQVRKSKNLLTSRRVPRSILPVHPPGLCRKARYLSAGFFRAGT